MGPALTDDTKDAFPAGGGLITLPRGRAAERDAKVQVVDQRPYRFSASPDNTETPRTGDTRIGAGCQYANLLDRDTW